MKQRNAVRGAEFGLYGAFMLYAATAVVTPMALLPMAAEFGFTFTGGGAIELSRSLLLLAVLLFSGFAAAKWGKVTLITLGMMIISLCLLIYSLAGGYWMVLLAMAGIGLGGGLVEALVNPMIEDLYPNDSGGKLNHINAFFSIGVLVTVLGAGELLTRGFSWRLIFVILGLFGIGLTLLFFLSGRHVVLPQSAHSSYHIGQILKAPRFYLLGMAMFFGGALESAFTFWSASYLQVSFDALPRGAGIGTALFAGGMAVGRIGASRLTKRIGMHKTIMLSALLGLVVGAAAYSISGLAAFMMLLFTAGLSVACYWPTIQAYAVSTMDADPTLLFIYLSCFGVPGFGLTPAIMGLVGDAHSLKAAFLLVPLFSLLMLAVMAADAQYFCSLSTSRGRTQSCGSRKQ